jgi:hypothetical protein
MSNLGAAGAIVSTVSDMAVWARASRGKLLSPSLATKRLRLSWFLGDGRALPSQSAARSLPGRYGLGLCNQGR